MYDMIYHYKYLYIYWCRYTAQNTYMAPTDIGLLFLSVLYIHLHLTVFFLS